MKQTFQIVGEFKDDLARINKFGKFGFIDKNGVQVIECKFDDANDFYNGFAKVKVNGKWFEIDSIGKDPNASQSSEEI